MFTIKKIWNALNHAGKPWQIALAIAFGMVVGFTPILSIHNLLILIVVLFLNIHLGIFILSVSLFGIVGFGLDPLFASIGQKILTDDSLTMLFTQWYNNPIGHLSGFNNTILMGSLVVSLLLFFLVYKFSSVLLVKYRTLIASKIVNIPLLNKLQFFKQEDVKEVKAFRIIGILSFLFLFGTLALFKIVILDNIIKSNIEQAVNKSSNKTLSIGNLSTSIFNSSIVIEDVLLIDKKDKSNNIKISNITIDINLSQLVFEKVVVENLVIANLSFPNNLESSNDKEMITKSGSVKKENSSSSSMSDLKSLQNINVTDVKKDFYKGYKDEFTKYKEYYTKIKPMFNSEKKIEEKRADGSFVYFDLASTIPDILIKKGTFSIVKNDSLINGVFQDFTTNQNLYQKPFKISINTKNEKIGSVILNVSLLETEKNSLDTLAANIKEFPIANINKKSISIINSKINTLIDLKIIDKKKLIGYENIDVISTDIAFNESNKYVAMLNKSLIGTKGIHGTINISGNINNPDLKIDSNLDKVLKKKIKNVLSSQKENIKKEIKEKVKSKIKNKLNSKLKGILGF